METIYVITPSFNAAGTITETLESVISQCGNFMLHYHVQDGGSQDETTSILYRMAEKIHSDPDLYSHISFSWHSHPDGGMYHAISQAVDRMALTSDSLMMWINADDLLLPDSLERMCRVVRSFPEVRWMGGQPCNITMHGERLPSPDTYLHSREIVRSGLCDGEHFPCLQQEGMVWRKSLFDEAGGINTSLRLAGDWDLWRRMASFEGMVLLPWSTGAFRRRKGQLSENLADYRAEMESVLSRRVRRRVLRQLLPGVKDLKSQVLLVEKENVYRLETVAHRWSIKALMRLSLTAIGWYWADTLYQKLLGAVRKIA